MILYPPLFPSPWSPLTHWLQDLRRGAGGILLRNSAGILSNGCAGGCACSTTPLCPNWPDPTPSQYHVTFAGVTLCSDCVACEADGISVRLSSAAALNGTYVLTRNGTYAWSTFGAAVPATASLYAGTSCDGTPLPYAFAIALTRISLSQFLLQVTDTTNTLLLFNATLDAANCCQSFTVANSQTACGCSTSGPIALATGGNVTVTPC